MGYSIGQVAFDSAVLQNGALKTSIYDGQVRGKEKKLLAASIHFRDTDSRTKVTAKDILINNYHFDDEFKNIAVDSISYGSASLVIDQGTFNTSKEPKATSPNISFLLSHISAQHTTLTYLSGDSIKASVDLNKLEISGAKLSAEKKISLQNLNLDGNAVLFAGPGLKARTGSFRITESQRSEINDVKLDILNRTDTVRGQIPSLNLTPEINKSFQLGYPVVDAIILNRPTIFASLIRQANSSNIKKEQSLELGSLTIIDGKIDLKQKYGNKSAWARSSDLNIHIDKISKDLNNHAFSLGDSKLNTTKVDVRLNDSIRLTMDGGTFSVELDHLIMGQDGNGFDMLLNSFLTKRLNLGILTKKGMAIELKKIDMEGGLLKLDSLDNGHIFRRIKENPSLNIHNIDLSGVNDKTEIYAFGIGYRDRGKLMTVDSFRFNPVMDRDSFNRMQTYQKDYMELSTKKISIRDFDFERLASDTSFHVNYIEILNPEFRDFKDKRLPFESGIIKPLPVDLLKKINIKFNVDSIRIYNGSITYEEFSNKTNSAANVHLSKVQLRVKNIRNHLFETSDSLYIGARLSFLDTAFVGLRFLQSYTDTLSAFLLQVRVGRFSLPALNPVIGPMAAAKVKSGYLDTLELKAIGREYLAHGKMKMLYKDLNVEFLDKKDQTRKTLVTKTISFIANLLVRRNNLKTTGSVFTERVRERSFINYWIKIVLSGALTNTGIRSNSKQEKKYRKALKKVQVPDIPDIEL